MTIYEDAAWDFMNSREILNLGDGYDSHDIIQTWEAAAKWEASRHNSKAENLAQSLLALRNFCEFNYIATPQLLSTLALVDQCLLENKPETIVP